jgi:predicted transcriptional regulator
MIIENLTDENVAEVLRAGVYADWVSVEERVQLREAGYLALSQGGSYYNITRKGKQLLFKYYPGSLTRLAENTARAVAGN